MSYLGSVVLQVNVVYYKIKQKAFFLDRKNAFLCKTYFLTDFTAVPDMDKWDTESENSKRELLLISYLRFHISYLQKPMLPYAVPIR
jgi:hypothetical protein